jgi:hypothetical protein
MRRSDVELVEIGPKRDDILCHVLRGQFYR